MNAIQTEMFSDMNNNNEEEENEALEKREQRDSILFYQLLFSFIFDFLIMKIS